MIKTGQRMTQTERGKFGRSDTQTNTECVAHRQGDRRTVRQRDREKETENEIQRETERKVRLIKRGKERHRQKEETFGRSDTQTQTECVAHRPGRQRDRDRE